MSHPHAAMPGSQQQEVQRLREYWLYIWKEHHYLPGRPAENSNPPVILKVPGLLEALEEAGKLTANSPKWEMYEGSGWSGKAPVAARTRSYAPGRAKTRNRERIQ